MTWQLDAESHAKEQFPREACGLVVIVNGRERFIPCENKAEGDDHFIIDPIDYANAEDVGDVVSIWHSHCNIGAEPSEADLVSCERSGLPWYIYSLPNETWFRFVPTGYKAPLIGRQFQHGVLDCYALIRDWYKENLGIELLDFKRSDNWWHKGENLYIDNFAKAGFEVAEMPQNGDVLLMQIMSPVANHAAIWLDGDMIVHHLHGRLSSRDVWDGYYRKNTVKVLRYAAGN